jgi:hypothetical protein
VASYSCSVQVISRGKGRSAVAAAAYRARERIEDERQGKVHDYRYKHDLVHCEILLPETAPERLASRAVLWNEIEQIEKQKNAQLAREVRVALPQELSREQNIELARDIAREFVKEGMIADLCIHDEETGNPHAHIMLTMRSLDENGDWEAKSRKAYVVDEDGERIRLQSGQWKSYKVDTTDWNKDYKVEQWRGMVADRTNETLERYLQPDRVDHRSYARQGFEQIPLERLSRTAWEMEQRGIQTAEGERRRQIEADNRRLEALATAREQVTRDMDGEQKRRAQEADLKRQREAATRRQQERREARERARQEREVRKRQYRKPTVSEPLRQIAAKDAEEKLRNQEKLYLDRPETLTERAEREQRDREKQQERNRRKLYGDPPTVRRAERQPRQYRKPEPSQPTPEPPRRFADLYDRPLPEQGKGQSTTHAPEPSRSERFSDLYDRPVKNPEQEHAPEPTRERRFSDLYDSKEREQDKPEQEHEHKPEH